MNVITKIVWDAETLAVLERHSYDYSDGAPIERACGASSEQKQAFANEKKVSDLLTENFQQFAGENQAILGNITGVLEPISDKGPSQFGMSPEQEAAERTITGEELATAGTEATNAVRGALASRGGGTSYLPSGSEAAIIGTIAQNEAVKEAEAQARITERGYDIGRQNWEFATEGLMKAPGALEAPVTGAGEAATGAAGQEMQGGTAITQANEAWMQPVGQIIGGVAQGLIPKLPGGTPPKPPSA